MFVGNDWWTKLFDGVGKGVVADVVEQTCNDRHAGVFVGEPAAFRGRAQVGDGEAGEVHDAK